MKRFEAFVSEVNTHIARHGFDDVLDLIPYFEELSIQNWQSLLDEKDGKPVNTTIYKSDFLRIVIIPWDGKKESSVHGHAEGGGLIKVLDGQLEETRYDPDDLEVIGTFVYRPGSTTYIHDMFALHQVKNPDQSPAYSLHMYTRRPN